MSSTEIGVALLGLGNVGAGVVKLLEDNAAAIHDRLGAKLAVRAIAVRSQGRKKRLVEVDPALLTRDVDAAIDRDDVAIVIELIGGVTEARAAILRAIERGKHVITANKAVLAEHGREIFAAAHAKGVDVYYEAAVCGGVPVIRVLREGLASDRIEQVIGIVNGTSNFILTAMAEQGRPFAAVLKEAQELGYAEADPTLDVGGGDAAHKLAILVMLCFGTHVDVAQIAKDGITELDPIDFEYAKRFGYVVKPLVIAREHEQGVEARVHPALVPAHWLLASVAGAKNALYVTSYALGPSMYYGAGAGMLPTAMAVVSDLIEVSRNMLSQEAGARPAHHRPLVDKPMLPLGAITSRYYLRFGVADKPGVLGQLTTILGHHGVSIAQVVQDVDRPETPGMARVFVLTHDAREGEVQAALAEIAKLPICVERGRLIRIAGEAHP
ncbi:MAG TPA: homoserine dehydrogenase [Kofleriaceae bacterium]|nr:homoserine dehydrogenase [Kofleriaceae bacterium]